MSAANSILSLESRGLHAAEIRTALTAWALYVVGTCSYCMVYQAVVWAVTPDLSRTVILALREWGAWLFLTPLAFRALRRMDAGKARRFTHYVALCLMVASVAVLVPVFIDQITQTRGVASSLTIFWPRFVATAVVVCFIWHAFLRDTSLRARSNDPVEVQSSARSDDPGSDQRNDPQRPSTLLVSKGADECLIRIEDIQYLSAAGNYIDICARNQRYLVRATMAQLEDLLPADRFIRIHRSHIVHMDQIERIRVQRSGSGTVRLRCGAELGISRSYRAQLQQYRPHSFLQ